MTKKQYFGRDLEAMSVVKNYYQWIIDECRSYIKEIIVEVGAGSGTFTKQLLENNFSNIVAIEPSNNMFELLKKNTSSQNNIVTCNNYFSEIYKNLKGKTKNILYINVLEHIEKDEEELALVYKTLETGGHICIFVPALPILYSKFDKKIEHYRRYTKKQLEDLTKSFGFRVVKSKYLDLLGIPVWWFSFCFLKQEYLKPSMSKLYDSIAIPIISKLEKLIPPPIGKNLLVIGEK
jgi:2-polyprenyl-3-methyl-5-hydroxy-6-metoxy-1,4-benzoquinol methylase